MRYLSDREDPLGCVGIGGRGKFRRAHLLNGHSALVERGKMGARRFGGIGGDECTTNTQRRSKQLVDRAYAFGDEESLPLTRVTASQVPCYGK